MRHKEQGVVLLVVASSCGAPSCGPHMHGHQLRNLFVVMAVAFSSAPPHWQLLQNVTGNDIIDTDVARRALRVSSRRVWDDTNNTSDLYHDVYTF